MGDLISRSDLIEAMTEVYKKHYAGDVSASGFTIAMEMVRKQPTAYNVEKVVAEIRKQFGCKDCEYADVFPTPAVCSCECAELEVINEICDILKRGGVDERT